MDFIFPLPITAPGAVACPVPPFFQIREHSSTPLSIAPPPQPPATPLTSPSHHRWILSSKSDQAVPDQTSPVNCGPDLISPQQDRIPGINLSEVIKADPFWQNHCQSAAHVQLVLTALRMPDPYPSSRAALPWEPVRRRSAAKGDTGRFWQKAQIGPRSFPVIAEMSDTIFCGKGDPDAVEAGGGTWKGGTLVASECWADLMGPGYEHYDLGLLPFTQAPQLLWALRSYIMGLALFLAVTGADEANGKRKCGGGSSLTMGDPDALE